MLGVETKHEPTYGIIVSVTYPTYAFWFYLFIIVVTVVGLVMFGIVAKWYKKRERNELIHEQRFVEDYYNKYIY